MRAPAVLLNVVVAGCLSGFVGYTIASRANHEALLRVQQERDLALVREHELRTQLQEALTSRTALEEESRRLQTNLSERLKRLEELAGQLATQGGQETAPPAEEPTASEPMSPEEERIPE